ncbi:MAG: hypothetical protein GWP10_08930, partial [Nitrospiraceae bacterium]|nr:hypothetical protein [Nitrospiraceae bacterium]
MIKIINLLINNRIVNSILYFLTLLLITLGLSLALNVKHTLNLVVGLLSIIGTIYFIANIGNKNFFSRNDKLFIIAIMAIPTMIFISMCINGFCSDKLLKVLRMLLAIFIFMAVREFKINPFFILFGILISLIFATINSLFEVNVLGYYRAHGFMNPIPYGNFSLLLSIIGTIFIIVHPKIKIKPKLILSLI